MNDIDNLRQDILNSETFCFYPYLEMSTNPSGHVKPCCYYTNVLFEDPDSKDYKNTHSILKGNTTLEDVWNSDAMVTIRRKLHKGEVEENCQKCARDGAASMRARSVDEYKNNYPILKLVDETIKNNYTAEHLPKRLELKPSNLCNLKCVMCNSYDSSQVEKELKELVTKFNGIEVWAGRYIKISETPGITESNRAFTDVDQADWSNDQQVWDSVIKIVPHLEVLSFAGGEPTLIPFVENILKYCVDNGYAKNIKVFLSSNFTNIHKKFLDLMPHFKQFELIASIDGIEKVNDYCRFPSKWSQVSANYLKAKQLMGDHPNIKILINVTVSLLNVMNLDSLLYWIDDLSKAYPYYYEWPYNLNVIWGPEDQRIENLPTHLKELAISRLNKYKQDSVVLKEFPELSEKVDLIIRELSKPTTPVEDKLLDEFVMRVSVLNEHRGVKLVDYIPDLEEFFNHE
jgi:MoaA/NifB/PqqE/SkfB family radical SAM enzyme